MLDKIGSIFIPTVAEHLHGSLGAMTAAHGGTRRCRILIRTNGHRVSRDDSGPSWFVISLITELAIRGQARPSRKKPLRLPETAFDERLASSSCRAYFLTKTPFDQRKQNHT